ncbi:potassium channel family protein [Geodermatophilus sp. DF01-2]|uniref:potassium channel family protein n=1 Tax=Geodermatophilus sp. DF01-2 TaxID=2559610 RepID=UPI001ADDC93C|nr:potassium channel family protein [Geodermatophilus sp. DF01_2]
MLSGPLGMVLVVLTWAILVVIGGALVHWPHLDDGFSLGSGLDPDRRGGFLDAVYVSLVTTATLGFGDIVPTAAWLRVVLPIQAFIGFALLTAAVTWVLQLYPALIRRRTLAVRLATLREVDTAAMLTSPDGTLAVQVLAGLADSFAQARVDVTQYAETYYFREYSADAALAAMVTVAADLADAASRAPSVDVRLAGDLVAHAVDDYLAVLGQQFLGVDGDAADRMRAYAADHGFGEGKRLGG